MLQDRSTEFESTIALQFPLSLSAELYEFFGPCDKESAPVPIGSVEHGCNKEPGKRVDCGGIPREANDRATYCKALGQVGSSIPLRIP